MIIFEDWSYTHTHTRLCDYVGHHNVKIWILHALICLCCVLIAKTHCFQQIKIKTPHCLLAFRDFILWNLQ